MSYGRRLIPIAVGIGWLGAVGVRGQAPEPRFEVASIKQNISPAPVRAGARTFPGGRVVALKVSLNNLIQDAYGVKSYQILEGPAWAHSEFYNIEAKVAGERTVTYEEVRPAWQALLADRFQLKLHHEMKDVPAYALVVGKNGPKMKASGPDATSQTTLPVAQAPTKRVASAKITMTRLALILTSYAGRPVVDQTGLEGTYDVTLEWAADDETPDAKLDAPALFTAVQEQLGLRLDPHKLPMDVLVIDHAERPSEN
jgi:uncharacterized protein (TIGR03435 family)